MIKEERAVLRAEENKAANKRAEEQLREGQQEFDSQCKRAKETSATERSREAV